jgi:hypothetical protein
VQYVTTATQSTAIPDALQEYNNNSGNKNQAGVRFEGLVHIHQLYSKDSRVLQSISVQGSGVAKVLSLECL